MTEWRRHIDIECIRMSNEVCVYVLLFFCWLRCCLFMWLGACASASAIDYLLERNYAFNNKTVRWPNDFIYFVSVPTHEISRILLSWNWNRQWAYLSHSITYSISCLFFHHCYGKWQVKLQRKKNPIATEKRSIFCYKRFE